MDKKPMMWMGKVSAWAALAIGLLFLGLSTAGYFAWPGIIAGILLWIGSYRTLRKMSGGLRLLCGAWGLGLGIAATRASGGTYEALAGGAAILALAGLALTVLHKEK